MKEKIWILNHYATSMFFAEGGRHYWIAKYLKESGYLPIIFCCNVKHGGNQQAYFPERKLWHEHSDNLNDIPFVAVKSSFYEGNGFSRVKNMALFALNVYISGRQYAKKYGKPDVIIASSVHPLTVIAGELLAKHFKVPCVCEIRDLWPESIFAYDPPKRKKWYAKWLQLGEKFMYKHADAVVMTWAGGWQYIKEMGWEKEIPEKKVVHIPNGVDYKSFRSFVEEFPYEDADLQETEYFNVVYTGSIRRVNRVDMLVEVAEILKEKDPGIRLLVWGSGDKYDEISKSINEKNLTNIILKARVDKKYIPSILTQADCCLLHNESTELDKYGSSQNKFFEYLASGTPILMTYRVNYSVIGEYQCGVDIEKQTPEEICNALISIRNMSEDLRNKMGTNAIDAVRNFDFQVLSKKIIDVIEKL